MVIIRTSAVEVSIQAVSPLSNLGPAAAGAALWAIADKLQAEATAAAHTRRRTTRYAKLIPDLPETQCAAEASGGMAPCRWSCDAGKRNLASRRADPPPKR